MSEEKSTEPTQEATATAVEAPTDFNGQYEHDRSENLEAFFAEVGMWQRLALS